MPINHDMNKIIFLDRDGVVNVDLMWNYVTRWEDFKFEDQAIDALKLLTDQHYSIVLISNQAGVGDHFFTQSEFESVHSAMLKTLKSEGVSILKSYFCLHGKKAGCNCRKPKTGLLEMASKDLTFEPENTYFIGDKVSDIEAGQSFGLKTILVRTGHGQDAEKKLPSFLMPRFIEDNLFKAVSRLLE